MCWSKNQQQSRGAEVTKDSNIALNNIKGSKNLTLSVTVYRNVKMRQLECEKKERCKYSGTGHMQSHALHMAKNVVSAKKKKKNLNHFKMACKSTQCQQQDWWDRRTVHEICQEEESHTMGKEEQDRSFDVVRVKYINLDGVKSVIFTELKSATSQRRTRIVYKIDSGADGNPMPLKNLKTLFPKSITKTLCTIKRMW